MENDTTHISVRVNVRNRISRLLLLNGPLVDAVSGNRRTSPMFQLERL